MVECYLCVLASAAGLLVVVMLSIQSHCLLAHVFVDLGNGNAAGGAGTTVQPKFPEVGQGFLSNTVPGVVAKPPRASDSGNMGA